MGASNTSTEQRKMNTILVTGAAGFIGSNFVDLALQEKLKVVVLDALTYAGHPENVPPHANVTFVRGDICDKSLVQKLLTEHNVDTLVNFAAESHVDRSIEGPGAFIQTNINGVFNLLSCSLDYWSKLPATSAESLNQNNFRFVQVSTDEVFGSLGDEGYFSEETSYKPNSPYSASKAAGDHLVRAWHHTYHMPTITTNCSNNYGPKQFPEKLIPHMIQCALSGKPLPVYGNGRNVRDWIHVKDHCRGVWLAATRGVPGETYCFGGNSERRNLDVVEKICDILDEVTPRGSGSYREQIKFVEDRKGHDWRYAIDDRKAQREIGFERTFASFEDGLRDTVQWYLKNQDWVSAVTRKRQ
jgi:dTDP-glucose 4,6-dehydratase